MFAHQRSGTPVRVLGIDPGLTRCGYAVVDGRGAGAGTAVSLGVIRTPSTDELPQRLAALRAELVALLTEFKPQVVAVERVFFQVNVRTAMSVGQASGLALCEAASAGLEVVQYTPNEVKDAVAGYGAATKIQVQKMVQARLSLTKPPQPADAADAAALALCHLARAPMVGRIRAAVAAAGGGAVIGSLRGEVLERDLAGTVLLEVGGVGYVVHVTPKTLGELEPSSTAFLYVHHHIREDAQLLYGFLARDERLTFQSLLAAHGVGAATAMAMLATHTPSALVDIVANNDIAALTLVPGVGKKTAERMMIELKSRLHIPLLDGDGGSTSGGSTVADVREALAGLGYGDTEIRDTLRELPVATDSATLLRDALQLLGRAVRDEFLDPGVATPAEEMVEAGLRPRTLAEFIGQRELKEHLTIVLEAARRRRQSVDHLLFAGPPGLGKTTLAAIVATEMNVQLHITSGPALERAGDLAAILTKLGEGDVLFIDEIHRLSRAVEEILYPAMEDFQLDIVVGKGPAASSIRLTMPPFTLVGATTRTGMITGPLRDRFGLVARLDYYDDDELEQVVSRASGILGVEIDTDGAWEIARRSRGTPRIGNRLLRRVRDFAEVRADGAITADIARDGLALFGVDDLGLDKVDRALLSSLCQQFGGGPVGLSTLAIGVGEQPDTVEDVYEPFLIQKGMIARTPRGRVAMPAAYRHLGLAVPTARQQPGLFDG